MRQPEALGQADAARGARGHLDRALSLQRAQVVLGRIGRAVMEGLGDLGPGGRETGLLDGLADEIQDLLLLGGQFFGHGASMPVFIYSKRLLGKWAPPGPGSV
jgi:hypothetical protein